MRQVNILGVNLGGWLIVEQWLTPSVFAGLAARDEWELSQTEQGRERIRQHRQTFITEADFRWLRDNDVTHVRLPVPYWAIGDADGYVSAHKELAWAMRMAETYGIQVLLDLHAAPGGQNIYDHSGRRGQMEWFDRSHQERTLTLLMTLATTYRDSPALWGIELLNEPDVQGRTWQLIRFYRRAYKQLRAVMRPGTYTVFHDGFAPLWMTGSLYARRRYPVAMDVHWYAFELPRRLSWTRYLGWSQSMRKWMLRLFGIWQPVIVGEWSGVLPQRFFDECSHDRHRELLRENLSMQQVAYARALQSYYWTYKAEGEGMWHFRSLVEKAALSR
ncbi:MAG: cellulase family glycosylhydrolase [Candidatus Saccharimonadales bacterium]